MGILTISPRETQFDVRGFHTGSVAAREALERHGSSFVHGYNAGLAADGIEALERDVDHIPLAERGFAYEGAGMAWALLDLLLPGRRDRLRRLLSGAGRSHVYMVHVGAGWALARLRLRPRSRLPALDPFLRWLVVDGYGFHEAFFHPARVAIRAAVPRRLTGYERRAFDQGVGRALWFVEGGDTERAAYSIGRFPAGRVPDLWSGLALAAAYTEAAEDGALARFRSLGAGHARQVTQGAAFAVAARHRAGNVVESTRAAAALLCDRTVEDVVAVVEDARCGLVADPAGEGYERWRARVGERLVAGVPLVAR